MPEFKDQWWYSTWFIFVLSTLSFLIVPAVVALILLIVQATKRKKFNDYHQKEKDASTNIEEKQKKIEELEQEIILKEETLNDKNKYFESLRGEFENSVESERQELLDQAKLQAEEIAKETEQNLKDVVSKTLEYKEEIETLTEEHEKLTKEVNRYMSRARKYKSEVTGLKNFEERFPHTIDFDVVEEQINEYKEMLSDDSLLGTVIDLHLHSNHSKELRKLSNATKKEINNVLEKYESRYNTKANKTIYNLMIIGLQAEIQILLFQLKYNNLNESKQIVKDIVTKYLAICGEGNRSILSTITKFLTEIEPLYIELIEIEYKYYVYREREKEEQRMIREQMKQEAAERKQLEEERKKLENEERKFKVEMERNKELLMTETDGEKIKQLEDRLRELEKQMMDIEDKKEEIASLALGKAGYVYIISNLGSFGENMFKIGMTRRMVPQDRIDELGSASVPFKFDVHALIFSDDAVGLEQMLHKELDKERVNKVNYRKEFFRTDIEKLKVLVEEIDPTAEFVLTMLAEEYRQTVAMEENVAV